MDISSTGNYHLVIKNGKASLQKCAEVFEEIATRNAEENGIYAFMNYMRVRKEYYRLHAEYTLMDAIFTKLRYRRDVKLVAFACKRGYFINTATKESYVNTLYLAIKRWESLKTRIDMKLNELAGLMETEGKPDTFNKVMGRLIALLGQHVPDDITLCRYNEFKKFLKEKHKPKPQKTA
jgi:hypothetical protein